MSHKSELIEKIVEQELEFFLAVQNRGGTANCQQNPDKFRIARRTNYEVQSDAFLESCLQDLQNAKNAGHNMMTEKYALMEELVPRTNFDEHIEKILEIEVNFNSEAIKRFSKVFTPRSEENFKAYVFCELQILSPKSLKLYYENLIEACNNGRNLVEERYDNLMRAMNLPTLAEQEKLK